ncbi:hypothetical protein L3V83_06600 [Thiotrichales bacterium 19X7-9]|nr:hypothetical protein [Thiotrichales bacterium 19X7-9]
MKIETILASITQGDLKTITPQVLKNLAKLYQEECGTTPWLFHNNHLLVVELENFSHNNQNKYGYDCAEKLVKTLEQLPNTKGNLARFITQILNKAFNTNYETHEYYGRIILDKSPEKLALQFQRQLKKHLVELKPLTKKYSNQPLIFIDTNHPQNKTNEAYPFMNQSHIEDTYGFNLDNNNLF